MPLPIAVLAGSAPERVDYVHDVAPMLKAHCASCHSGAEPAGNLDLTSAKSLARVIVPGQPDKSQLVIRLLGTDGNPRMPMGFAPLSDAQIGQIKSWISQGASTTGVVKPPHWAYVTPVRPPLPVVKNVKWARNPIDRFVLAKLEKEGLKPSLEAPRETLLRRVTLDLTGLNPTPSEIDAFLADKRPDAYERVVDRLLAKPQYGEHMARGWLDLARYADSDGYEKDLKRTAWKYRDWVIEAFNRNEPFDFFTIDQLAGDLLPNPSMDQLVATGFNRNTMMNLEGGVDQAEAHFNVVLDRVGTTGTVFLGSTIQCARCHDHKYDPFTQKDFYQLAAFFSNAEIDPVGSKAIGEEKWYEPQIEVPSPEQAAQRSKLRQELVAANQSLKVAAEALAPEREKWVQAAKAVPAAPLSGAVSVPAGETAKVLPDGSIRVEGENLGQAVYELTAKVPVGRTTGIRLEALPDSTLALNGPGRATSGNFILTKFEASFDGKPLPIREAAVDFTQPGYSAAATLDDDPNSGWALYGQIGKPHDAVYELASPLMTSGELKIKLSMTSSEWPQHTIGRFRLSLMEAEHPTQYAIPAEVRTLLTAGPDDPRVAAFYQTVSPTLVPLRVARDGKQTALNQLQAQIPTALVLRDKPATGPLKTNVHIRGEFLSKGAEVTACSPAFLPAMASSLPANRLGLAKWIVDPRNPLTARVEVNRLWEGVFGRGIVETSEDFGTQGSPPTHRELLDWLATEFIARKWNMKSMLKLIVTSATYRQSSVASAALMSRDPSNALLARGPRYRLEAEAIRDISLQSGGVLSLKVGGPSVFPLQPDGTWDSPYSGESWMTSNGENRFRRGIYTFWKRTAPYPSFAAFDATTRESCTVRRIRTNTPLQALAMLNDAAIMDAAHGLARRMQGTTGDDGRRLAFGFRCTTGRWPGVAERDRLVALLKKLRSRYAGDPTAAKKMKATPESAAWTMAANVLLNLDETITKE